MNSLCIVIPVFNHADKIRETVFSGYLKDITIIMVDDGSQNSCAEILASIQRESKNIILLRLEKNQGKGAAVISGLQKAASLGFFHALQVDADGQHDLADVKIFSLAAQNQPDALIVGAPIFDESIPKKRLYGRYLTLIWNWIETLSFEIKDSMCGFRVYPIRKTLSVIESEFVGRRMDFDSEILVRMMWRGTRLIFIPTRVIYPVGGRSNFRMWKDNVLISRMHVRLFFGMLRRLPMLLTRKFEQ